MSGADSILRNALVSLLLGSGEHAAKAAGDVSHGGGWVRLVYLAEAWHVLPHLDERVSELRVILEPEARLALRQRSAAAFVRSMLHARRGIEALQQLDQGGIPAAAFKGLASMAILYPNPGLRTIQDADILVPEPDLRNAIALLADLGLKPDVPGDLSAYLHFVSNSPGFGGNQAIQMSDGEQGEIDLHWRLGLNSASEVDPRRVITRVQTARLLGSTIRVVAAADALLLTTRHTLRNNFAPQFICRDLLDFRLWWDHLDDTGAAMDRAQECGLLAPVFAMCRIHARFDPARAEHPSIREIEKRSTDDDRKAADRLADLFASQTEHGTLNKDVVYLVQPGSLKQILTGLSRDWRGYRRIMQSMEAKSDGAPSPLWQRVAGLAHTAVRLRLEDVRRLRTLAAMKSR